MLLLIKHLLIHFGTWKRIIHVSRKFPHTGCSSRGKVSLPGARSLWIGRNWRMTKGRAGWEKEFLLLTARSGWLASPHPVRPLQPHMCSPPTCPFQQEFHGWVCGDCRAPDQLGVRKGGAERMADFSPPLAPWSTGGSAVVNIHWYVNGLRPGGKFWKVWVKTSIYPTLDNWSTILHHLINLSLSQYIWCSSNPHTLKKPAFTKLEKKF